MKNSMDNLGQIQLIVKPVQRISVQGRHLHQYRMKSGNNELMADTKKTKVANATETLVLHRDESGTRYKMGLEELISNPFGDNESEVIAKYNLSNKWLENNRLEKILKNDRISNQVYLEITAGVDPDTYSPVIRKNNFVGAFQKGDDLSELEKLKIVLYDSANIFNTSTPRGRLIIQALRSHPAVASSRDIVNPNVHRWYIAEEYEDAVESKRTNDLINEAIAELFMLLKKQPYDTLYSFVTLLTDNMNNSLIKGKTNLYLIDDKLNKYIKEKSKHQVNNINKFLEATSLFKSNPELFHIETLVQAGRTYGVISVMNGQVYWDSQKGNPELYKFSSIKNFREFIMTEFNKHNPMEKENSIYKIYVEELIKRGYEYSGNAL
jgi:hypothetical protein